MPQKNILQAVWEGRCPRCRQGRLFKYQSYLPNKFDAINESCTHCGVTYEQEPGFFFGAMYVNYAFSVAFVVVIGVVLYNFFGNPEMWVYITAVMSTVILTIPFTFRYSKILYLYWFGPFRFQKELNKDNSL